MPHTFGLSDTAQNIFKNLYSFSDETIANTFERVAKEFATNDDEYKFAYNILSNNIFRANTPVFFNAGTEHKMFSACWVVGLDDSMNSIYDIANVSRKIFQHGAGIGIPIGNLREKDAYIYEGKKDLPPTGKSSGPVSFMKLYDVIGESTKSGGRTRRAAILCSIPVWHPDIMEFIGCKEIDGKLSNMNISVSINDKFMQALKDNVTYQLVSPSNGETIGEINSSDVWNKLVEMSWKTADPGVLFIDTINKYNILKSKIQIQCTNPSLRSGTKVITNEGIFPIEELENKKFKIINQNGEYSQAECFMSGKNKTLYEITLEGNKKYYSTAEHKWPVFNGKEYEKVETNKLKKGDYLPIVKINTLGYGNIGSYDDGFLIGWNLGDGWITDRSDNLKRQYGFFFSKDDIDNGIFNKIEKHLSFITGNRYNKNITRNGCMEINTSCKKIDEFFKYFKVDKKSEGLPSIIWKTASEDFRKGLIDGLFSSDGSISKNGNLCVFTSSHEKLANDVFELLGFYGIKTLLSKKISNSSNFPNGKKYNRTYVRFDVRFCTSSLFHFRNIFKLTNKRKNDRLWKLDDKKERFDQYNTRIKSIKKTNIKEDVWDISVYDNTHTFKLSHVITGNCGEQPLIPFTSCNLGSINVHKFCIDGKFDFEKLYDISYNIMKIMDNIIDVMYFPDKRFEDNTKKYRPVGVGVMGLADTLFELGLKYDGPDGRNLAGQIIKTITTACISASADMASVKGKFHNYDKFENDALQIISEHTGNNTEIIEKVKKYGLRNIQFTTCAPTGTTALSCDCSYGIEPSFGLVFQKNMMTGETVIIANPVFKKKCEKESWYDDKILEKIFQNGGTLKGLRGIPKEIRDIFVTAHDIKFKDRIDMQSELQKYCSSAISSTINLPSTATKEEISDLYMYAYEKGLKGVTIYRDGSKHSQPITFSKNGTEVKSNFKRPNKLVADTHILETGNGKMYVIVSKQNGKPVEIFMNMGKSGQLFNVFTESLGRVISIALQHGVPMEEIIKTMIGINSDRPTWFRFDETDQKPAQILSIPDGIAKLLQRFYTNEGKKDDIEGTLELCPKCGTYSLVIIEGCKVCQNCGESACG